MKIKTKKQLNLPQLIEWAWENDIRSRQIRADQDISAVSINEFGDIYTTDDVKRDETFTVEVEEEITEDTVFNYLLLTYKKDNGKIETHWYEDKCKRSVLSQSDRLMYVSEQLSITYFDDKGIPHLIWTHEKGLVE